MYMFENVPIVPALTGGVLIGLSASLMLLASGRIAGISGILNGCLDGARDKSWRILFLLGLLLGAAIYYYPLKGRELYPEDPAVPFLMIVAGFLVGFGTRLGSGCTSGHGVCGLGRLSPRSLMATIAFVASGMLAVFLLKFFTGGAQ
jgi:uncharacterized membrane protein YedE/YeeE